MDERALGVRLLRYQRPDVGWRRRGSMSRSACVRRCWAWFLWLVVRSSSSSCAGCPTSRGTRAPRCRAPPCGPHRPQVHEHVAVDAVRRAALLGRALGERDRVGVADAALVRELGVQDDQARLVDVGDVGRVLGADVDAGEVAARLGLACEPPGDLGLDVLGVQPLGLVLGAAGDVGLQVVPVLARPRCRSTSRGRRARRARSGSCPARRRASRCRGTRAGSRGPCAPSRSSARRRRTPCARAAG